LPSSSRSPSSLSTGWTRSDHRCQWSHHTIPRDEIMEGAKKLEQR
jgi:hypothetical protein